MIHQKFLKKFFSVFIFLLLISSLFLSGTKSANAAGVLCPAGTPDAGKICGVTGFNPVYVNASCTLHGSDIYNGNRILGGQKCSIGGTDDGGYYMTGTGTPDSSTPTFPYGPGQAPGWTYTKSIDHTSLPTAPWVSSDNDYTEGFFGGRVYVYAHGDDEASIQVGSNTYGTTGCNSTGFRDVTKAGCPATGTFGSSTFSAQPGDAVIFNVQNDLRPNNGSGDWGSGTGTVTLGNVTACYTGSYKALIGGYTDTTTNYIPTADGVCSSPTPTVTPLGTPALSASWDATGTPDQTITLGGSQTSTGPLKFSYSNTGTGTLDVTACPASISGSGSIDTPFPSCSGASGTKNISISGISPGSNPVTVGVLIKATGVSSIPLRLTIYPAPVISPTPTGTLSVTPSSCTIPIGSGTCNVNVTWTTSNLIPTQVVAVTRNNPDNTTVSTSASGSLFNAISPGDTTFHLYQVQTDLADPVSASADCQLGSKWDLTLSKCVSTTQPTATLNGRSCYIQSGASTCNVTLSWTSANLTSPTTSIDNDNPNATPSSFVPSPLSAGSRTVTLGFGNNNFRFYNGAYVPASITLTATCARGVSNDSNGVCGNAAVYNANLTINNATSGSFLVKTPWTLKATTNPVYANQPVEICSRAPYPADQCASDGSTDASGVWTLTGSFDPGLAGTTWTEYAKINGTVVSNDIHFTVVAIPSQVATLSASPTNITAGASSTLTWSCGNSTGGTLTPTPVGWTYAQSGTISTGNLDASTKYTLTCTNPGIADATATQTVTVGSAPLAWVYCTVNPSNAHVPNAPGAFTAQATGGDGKFNWSISPGYSYASTLNQSFVAAVYPNPGVYFASVSSGGSGAICPNIIIGDDSVDEILTGFHLTDASGTPKNNFIDGEKIYPYVTVENNSIFQQAVVAPFMSIYSNQPTLLSYPYPFEGDVTVHDKPNGRGISPGPLPNNLLVYAGNFNGAYYNGPGSYDPDHYTDFWTKTTPGSYTARALVDRANHITETNKLNNQASVNYTVTIASPTTGTLTPATNYCKADNYVGTCGIVFTWNTLNPRDRSIITKGGPTNIVQTGNSGTASFNISPSDTPAQNTFYLYNNGLLLDQKTVSAAIDNSLVGIDAGPDQTITLPTNSVKMAGNITGTLVGQYSCPTYTDDGSQAYVYVPPGPYNDHTSDPGYQPSQDCQSQPHIPTDAYDRVTWTKMSGPAGGTITNPSSVTTTITNLNNAGVYVFRLAAQDVSGVTDFSSNSGAVDISSEVQITVHPSATNSPDLTAGAVTPLTATLNTPKTFSSTITNVGTVTTGSSFPNFFQVATGGNGAGSISDLPSSGMATLAAGASANTTTSYTFNSAGTFSIRACADKANSAGGTVIPESNEANNCGPWGNVLVSIAPLAVPTITFTASPSTIYERNAKTTITWSTTDATTCTGTSLPTSYTTTHGVLTTIHSLFDGTQPTSGTISITPPVTTDYTLTCIGAGGTSNNLVHVKTVFPAATEQ